jgi:hypothetical protein
MPAFYLFWITIRPVDSNSGELWALLTGSIAALARFFIPAAVDTYGFGISRYLSAFIDYVSFPVLFPMIVAALTARLYPRSGITDYTGFTLLALVPVALVCSALWSSRRDILRLVCTPLLWTAIITAFYPLIQIFRNGWRREGLFGRGILCKIIAVLGMLICMLLPPAVWWNFFRQKYIYGFALLFPLLVIMAAVCVCFLNKKRLNEIPETTSGKK